MLEDRAGARAPSADGTRSRYSSTPIPPAPRRGPAGGAAPGKARARAAPVAALGPPRGRHRKPREAQGAGVLRVVPDAERTGAPRQQGMLWAGNNLTAVSLVLGGVASAGLGFWPAVSAITAGAAAGAAVLGLLAAQGPRLGVSQLVHARALLGSSGSAVLSGGVLLLTTGFGAAQLVIQGDALREVSGWPEPVLILACTVPAVLLALAGRARLQAAARVTAIVASAMIGLVIVLAITRGHLPPGAAAEPRTPARCLAGAAVMLTALLGWGPLCSDFTTSVPARHGPAAGMWAAAGAAAGTMPAAVAGAYITAAERSGDAVAAAGRLGGPLLLVLIAATLVNTTAIDCYTGGLQLLLLSALRRAAPPRQTAAVLASAGASAALALLAYRHWTDGIDDMLTILLLLFVPWASANLTDYYLLRRGHYDIAAMLAPGRRLESRGLAACLAGLGAEIPCISQPCYTGPAAALLGRADISWLAGAAVTCAVYLAWGALPARWHRTRPARPPARHARPAALARGHA